MHHAGRLELITSGLRARLSRGTCLVLAFAVATTGMAAAQERGAVDLPLFPQLSDYSESCAGTVTLSSDPYNLGAWQGEQLSISPDQLLEVGILYSKGGATVPANAELATRLFRYLAERPSPIQSRAKYLAAVMILDTQGSPEMDRLAAQMLTEAANARVTGAARELGALYEIGRGVPQDFEQAAIYYRIAGSEGDAESAFSLARLYADNLISDGAQEAALNLAKLGLITLLSDVNQGRCSALVTVARLYEEGDLVAANEQAAAAWYEAAASTGNARAMAAIARRYYGGIGVEPNVQLAIQWWRRAAELGSMDAKANIGMIYATGDGVEPNAQEATRWLTEAAQGGNVSAMVHLASLYRGELSALAVSQADPEQAYFWTERAYAADPTRVSVIMNLARALISGEGTALDPARAFNLFNQAMRLGNRSALREMASAYLNGNGVERNPERALQIFRQAAERGDLSSYSVIVDMYRCGIGVEANAAMADLWLGRAAAVGDVDSLIVLSNRTVKELNAEDQQRTLQLLFRAAANNSREAMIRLSEIFARGEGVEKNAELAARWEALAIRPGPNQEVGLYLLAEAFRTNTAHEWDPVRVQQLLTQSHEMGYVKATTRLGKYHIRPGDDGMENIDAGVELLRQASSRGSSDAMRELAEYFRSTGNLPEALGWLDYAIVAGLDTAQVLKAEWAFKGLISGQPEPDAAREVLDNVIKRGVCSMSLSSAVVTSLASGVGGPGRDQEALDMANRAIETFRPTPDEVAQLGSALLKGSPNQTLVGRGIELLERSMELGSIRGYIELAQLYMEGNGVPLNFEKAMELLNQAAAAGEVSAYIHIGRAYLQGVGGSPDYAAAWSSMERAAAAGIPEAFREMGHWYLRGLGRPENVDEGLSLLERAASMGDTKAILDLANVYSVGFVVDQRPDIAVKWLETGAAAGSLEAMHRLGLAYLLGLGVPQDEAEAQRWFRLSGSKGYAMKADATQVKQE
ncbi:tetratricopeptide repeat protein [Albidovulum sediminicola]|uniref:SEL1-like repeat protein n=1 Tax=Albidovulum sediminicola TaxID=2984331 RepID=A0ABT2Z4L7_9RHOB|nr:SEL1-like repeat protein [Defluviimonas sp. WL0075]MCV2866058.1 SEL1-like repeat protein [Defluviimonas sp. WL0075]